MRVLFNEEIAVGTERMSSDKEERQGLKISSEGICEKFSMFGMERYRKILEWK